MKIFDFENYSHINEKKYSLKSWTIKDYVEWFLNIPIVKAFLLEGKDYKNMSKTFGILLMEKLNIKHRKDLPTPEEIKEAVKQLKDVPKIMPFCALLLMPVPFVLESYIIVAIIVHKLSGGEVNILPDKFDIVIEDLEKKKIFSFFKKKKKKD